MPQENTGYERMAEEERIREKTDKDGNKWTKVYSGGGDHFRNWLNQTLELREENDVQVEEVDSRGFQCYEQSGEKMYRIWVKDSLSVSSPPGHRISTGPSAPSRRGS